MPKLSMSALLTAIKEAEAPIGAMFLSRKLDIPPATIGRMLKEAEDRGYLVSVSNKGRQLSAEGEAYLQDITLLDTKRLAANKLIQSTMRASSEYVLEVLQIRKLIEPYSAMMACEYATDEQLNELELLLLEHTLVVKGGGLGSDQDLRIHLAIAKCTGNVTLYHILELLLTENDVYTTLATIPSAAKRSQIVSHDALIHAILARNKEGAKLAMEAHLEQLTNAATAAGTLS